MNPELVEEARKIVPSVPLLVNLVSQRVRQLNNNFPPLVEIRGFRSDYADVALREIIEGKLTWEMSDVVRNQNV